jgi:hypothetical protein
LDFAARGNGNPLKSSAINEDMSDLAAYISQAKVCTLQLPLDTFLEEGTTDADRLVRSLAESVTLETLHVLNVNETEGSSDDPDELPSLLVAIARALPMNCSLTALGLYSCAIGDPGVRLLADAAGSSASLTSLDLRHNDLSGEV